MEQINKVAVKSEEPLKTKKATGRNVTAQIEEMSAAVLEYFKDSNSILITTEKELHDYVDKCIEYGYAGIDTETTGLDRVNDYIVGASLYVPGMPDCYIPIKHRIPLFEQLYKDQLTYEQVAKEFERLRQVKLIFANADFDLAMIYKDIKVDFNEACYYDVIIAWRCLKENEKDNRLKALYNKYVLKGRGNPKAFSDFFTPTLFPYCKPEVAKLYAGNDAKITFELFQWQLPYITKGNPKCQKMHLEHIADLIWNVEFPLIPVCQNMHRNGMYLDNNTATMLKDRYNGMMAKERAKLAVLVQEVIDQNTYKVPSSKKKPFTTGASFNPESTLQVKYLLYDLLQLPKVEGQGTGKEVLHDINLPVTNQILKVRSLGVLISTFVDKMPAAVTKYDNRIHAEFKQLGADTGRLSCKNPNMMNIPSRSVDIRHMFRATPGYVMMSSDYSAQEPRLTAHVSNDPKMIQAFKDGKDIYASIASVAFGVPYEKCLEFHPETHEYQKDGKKRRGEAKTIVLGITYGRSIPSIADQLYGTRDDMTDEEKVKGAQHVYDAVLNSFPNLRSLMTQSQDFARQHGFVETILGRRRHLPDMQLPEFEFVAMPGYINPDIDPLDPSTLKNKSDIPERIVKSLQKEFKGYKYFGQIVKRTKQLKEEKIKVINNRPKINDATRQVVNSIIQGERLYRPYTF